MHWFRSFLVRLGWSGGYEPIRREIDEELRFHLEQRIDANISQGMSPEAARADAIRRLGNTEEIREEGAWILAGARSSAGGLLADALQDTAHGLRRLRRRPGLALASVGILALGLSASTAVFTYINAFFQPVPGAAATDALKVHRATEDAPFGPLSYPDFLSLTALAGETFSGVEGVSTSFGASARHEDLTEVVFGHAVTGDFFALLEVDIHRGRGLTADDDRVDAPPAVVLSHAYWLERYAGSNDALGQTLFLNNNPYTIVGVAGPEFIGTSSARRPEVWLTFEEYKRVYWARDDRATNPEGRAVIPVVRLAGGVTRQQASDALTARARGLDQATPLEAGPRRFLLDQATWIDPSDRLSELPTARIMLAAAAGLLLLACVNVANLMLAVGSRREREMAMRAAIGASRGRLIRQLLTESLYLGLAAGVVALALAGPASNWIGSFFARPSVWGSNAPRTVHLDPGVFLFALAAAVLTGVVTGVLPAIRASRREVVGSLKESPGAESPSHLPGVRDLLVSAQIALSLTLLVVAGLVLRTLDSAWSTDPGFRTENVLASYVSTSSMGTPVDQRHRFYRELAERLETLPWVSAATVADYAPLSPHGVVDVRLDTEGTTAPVTVAKVVPGYFERLDIPLLAGRTFESTDTTDGNLVAVVDEVMAARFFGSESALGRRISWTESGEDNERTSEIVGVVANTRMSSLLGEAEAVLYLSYPQIYSTPGNAVMIVTNVDAGSAVPLLEEEYRTVDPRLAVVNVLPYSDVITGFVYVQRMNAQLFSVVALLGLVLAAVGIFGIMNLAVSLRTREIGIRLAIGAGGMDITRLVARRVLVSVALGILAGLAGAMVSVRWTESLLYGVEPADPVSFSVAAVVLAAAAAMAAYLPTRRALGVDPMGSLRTE